MWKESTGLQKKPLGLLGNDKICNWREDNAEDEKENVSIEPIQHKDGDSKQLPGQEKSIALWVKGTVLWGS